MSVDYTFYTFLTSEETLAEHFGRTLGLGRSFSEQPSPLVSDSLWVSIQVNLDDDWAEEAAMLGSEAISLGFSRVCRFLPILRDGHGPGRSLRSASF